jgi:hypothetical protein
MILIAISRPRRGIELASIVGAVRGRLAAAVVDAVEVVDAVGGCGIEVIDVVE